tara:strand:+ start:634 stop:795 length:162 start_codon:yes stop_codon:yes gene_type:complete
MLMTIKKSTRTRKPKRRNPYVNALRLGIYQGKKVRSKKGKGSYQRSRAHGPDD